MITSVRLSSLSLIFQVKMDIVLSGSENSTDDEFGGDNLGEGEPSSSNVPVAAKIQRVSRTRPYSNIVHKWFSYDDGKSKCKFCSTLLSGKNGTNLKNHLEKKHKNEYQRYLAEMKASQIQQKQPSPSSKSTIATVPITECFRKLAERRDALKKGSPAYVKNMKAIKIAFVMNSLPYHLIEDPAIKNMIATVSDGRMTIMDNRQELASGVSDLSNELKTGIKSSLQTAKFVSLTIDLWSRPGFSSSMMGVTCHFFDRHLNRLRRVLLACRPIKQPHTSQHIFDLYNDVKIDWDLDESHILRIVTDNGSNIVKAFK